MVQISHIREYDLLASAHTFILHYMISRARNIPKWPILLKLFFYPHMQHKIMPTASKTKNVQ